MQLPEEELGKGFEHGQIVYNIRGEEYRYEAEINGQHFGCKLYQCYDCDSGPYTDIGPLSPFTPYLEPPTARLHESVKTLQEAIETYHKELEAVRQETIEAKGKLLDLESAAEKHEEFRLLLDYLDGKITHVVLPDGSGIKIQELEEALVWHENDHWSSEKWPRALGLFAPENPFDEKFPKGKRVTWSVARYKSGGHWENFIPCRSEEEARQVIREEFGRILEEWRENKVSWWTSNQVISRILKNNEWLAIPEELLEYRTKKEKSYLEEKRAKLARQLAEVEAELGENSQEGNQ